MRESRNAQQLTGFKHLWCWQCGVQASLCNQDGSAKLPADPEAQTLSSPTGPCLVSRFR